MNPGCLAVATITTVPQVTTATSPSQIPFHTALVVYTTNCSLTPVGPHICVDSVYRSYRSRCTGDLLMYGEQPARERMERREKKTAVVLLWWSACGTVEDMEGSSKTYMFTSYQLKH